MATAAPAGYDYFAHNRLLIRNGVQAVLMCNGLFTSRRNIEQVFEQELAYLSRPLGNAEGGNYRIDREMRAVRVGGGVDGPAIRSAFRKGIGCVVMAPHQDWTDINSLPELMLPPLPGELLGLADRVLPGVGVEHQQHLAHGRQGGGQTTAPGRGCRGAGGRLELGL